MSPEEVPGLSNIAVVAADGVGAALAATAPVKVPPTTTTVVPPTTQGSGPPPPPSKCTFATPMKVKVKANATFLAWIVTSCNPPASSLTATGVPSWATFTDSGKGYATLTTSAAVVGRYKFSVTAVNAVGTTTQEFALTVTKVKKKR
jgi:hypothetical protein